MIKWLNSWGDRCLIVSDDCAFFLTHCLQSVCVCLKFFGFHFSVHHEILRLAALPFGGPCYVPVESGVVSKGSSWSIAGSVCLSIGRLASLTFLYGHQACDNSGGRDAVSCSGNLITLYTSTALVNN